MNTSIDIAFMRVPVWGPEWAWSHISNKTHTTKAIPKKTSNIYMLKALIEVLKQPEFKCAGVCLPGCGYPSSVYLQFLLCFPAFRHVCG